ncbi:MAG: hypothetical protein E7632_08770 [Ruminococcaceae bacterium]|nr:hypothetical protein [Oscillospiraceae bacterium]
MKKILAVVLALVMCLAIVSCGVDKQPAIDAFNKTSAAFNEVSTVINADIESYDEEFITVMVDMANLLNEYQVILSDDTELTQEDVDAMIEWFGTVDAWVEEVKAALNA